MHNKMQLWTADSAPGPVLFLFEYGYHSWRRGAVVSGVRRTNEEVTGGWYLDG